MLIESPPAALEQEETPDQPQARKQIQMPLLLHDQS